MLKKAKNRIISEIPQDFVISEYAKSYSDEKKFRGIFNRMSSCVAVYEPINNGKNFIFKDFNPAAERAENVKKECLVGRKVTEVFPGVVKFGIFDIFKRVYRTGRPQHFPLKLYKDNRISGWRDNYIFKLPTGEIVAVYDDVSKQKRYEEELALSAARWRITFDAIREGLCIINNDGEIEQCNKAFSAIFNKQYKNIIGKKCFEIVHNTHKSIPGCPGRAAYKAMKRKEVTLKINQRWYNVCVDPIVDGNNKVQGCAHIFIDITDKKNIEDAKEHLIRDVSHSLKTPIAIAEMTAEICTAALDAQDNARAKSAMKILTHNIRRIHKDIYNVLTFDRYEKGKNRLARSNISLSKLIHKIISDIGVLLKNKDIGISIRVRKGADKLFANATDISILIQNLLDNSLKFTGKGNISITCSLAGKMIKIRVKDTGKGIDKVNIANIFQRFYQEVPTTEGVGIGLAICKEIAKSYGGSIKIYSKGFGKGTEVVVLIPQKKTKLNKLNEKHV